MICATLCTNWYRDLATRNEAFERADCCLAAGPGEGGQVDVAAGENHAKFWGAAVGTIRKVQGRNNTGFQERRYGDGAGRLDDDFHAFPNESGRGDDFFFGDQENAIDIFSKNRESARGERSA